MSAAVLWGFSDFVAGIQARRVPLAIVTSVSQASSLLLLALVVVLASPPTPPEHDLVVAGLAGISVAIGLTGFYSALARGTMSIVAPVAATGVVIPVLFGLLSGEQPGSVQLVGVAAAIAGVILVSRQTTAVRGEDYRRSIALAVVAAVGFGWFFVGMGETSSGDVFWPLLAARIAAVAVLAAIVLYVRPSVDGVGPSLAPLLGLGLLDLGATSAYVAATSHGLLSLVSVFGSMYAVITILLARALLHERINRVQGVGVVCAMLGVALISAGT